MWQSHPYVTLPFIFVKFTLVTDPIAVASNDCAKDCLHKDHCMQAFGRNTLSKPHTAQHITPWSCVSLFPTVITVDCVDLPKWSILKRPVIVLETTSRRMESISIWPGCESSSCLWWYFYGTEVSLMSFQPFFNIFCHSFELASIFFHGSQIRGNSDDCCNECKWY